MGGSTANDQAIRAAAATVIVALGPLSQEERQEAMAVVAKQYCPLCWKDLSQAVGGKCYCAPCYDE